MLPGLRLERAGLRGIGGARLGPSKGIVAKTARQASSPNVHQDVLSLGETIGPQERMARSLVLDDCLGVRVWPGSPLVIVGAYPDDLSPDRFQGTPEVVDVQSDGPTEDCELP